MKTRFFITATGTEIGKTFITAALVRQAKALGKSVMAYKALLTGFDPSHPEATDTGALLQSLDLSPTIENIERLTPWRYAAPLAPSMAARLENRVIESDDLAAWSRKVANGPEDIVMIEGVGGIMVPINDRHTVVDWMQETGIPALLVTGSYLGTISHTLTALEVLAYRKIPVAGVIVNESEGSSVRLEPTAEEIRRWTKAPVVTVKRRDGPSDWKDATELRVLLSHERSANCTRLIKAETGS